MRPFAFVLLLTVIVGATPAVAQWRIGLGMARESAHGFARGTGSEEDQSFIPHQRFTWTARVESPGDRIRGALDLRYAEPDIALTGPDLTVIVHENLTTVVGVRPSAVIQLARPASHVTIRGEAGPLLELWSFEGQDARWRLSAELGLSLMVGLGGRMSGVLTGSGSVMPSSPFEKELPEDYERRAGWRWGIRGLVMYRL